jgi:hypothetical protein
MMTCLARVYLMQSKRMPHLQTRAQRHSWVRARLAYPAPRVEIGSKAPEPQRRFVRRSGLQHGTKLELDLRVRAWVKGER